MPDAAHDPRFAGCAVVRGAPHVRFYAGAPLCSPAGHALGTLCVFDDKPRRLNRRQKEGLRALSRQVLAQMELKRTIPELRLTAIERHVAETALRKSEERFQKFMNNGPAIAFIKDAVGRYRVRQRTDRAPFPDASGDWIGKTDAELLGKESAANVVEHDLTVLNDEKTVRRGRGGPGPGRRAVLAEL